MRGAERFRRNLQDVRSNRDALLDKDRDRRNKGTRQKPSPKRVCSLGMDGPRGPDFELLVLAFRAGAPGERNGGR